MEDIINQSPCAPDRPSISWEKLRDFAAREGVEEPIKIQIFSG
jgi:hypothetical protein